MLIPSGDYRCLVGLHTIAHLVPHRTLTAQQNCAIYARFVYLCACIGERVHAAKIIIVDVVIRAVPLLGSQNEHSRRYKRL